jgi:hypothetical protein
MKTTKHIVTLAASAAMVMVGCSADPGPDGAEEVGQTSEALYSGSCPASAVLSQGFKGAAHDGIDLANVRGTPIYAVGPGVVTASSPASGYGQWIRIRHDDGSMTEYGHMYERLVGAGQRVAGGQLIARMGAEGEATGPHLHLRTYASANRVGAGNGMDPIVYLHARGISIPCGGGSGGGGGGGGGGGACSVHADGKLYCANRVSPMHAATNAGSPVVNTLRSTSSWFDCWGTGERHAGGNSTWYHTLGDDNGNWGWVPGVALSTPDSFDANPGAHGLKHCN